MSSRIMDPIAGLIPDGYDLIPGLNELYELRLALMELSVLRPKEHGNRLAYFAAVSPGVPTNHFRICTSQPLKITTSGGKRRQFFQSNPFRTGYTTHGFFPYRGKFHPQMVKALLNVMDMRPGETVLDPMMGSGTTLVEASTLGIHSIGVDVSPFCKLMAQAKCEGLRVDPQDFVETAASHKKVDVLFGQFHQDGLLAAREDETHPLRRIAALAFLDARGYSERSKRLTMRGAFGKIIEKYAGCLSGFARVRDELGLQLGNTTCLQGDARELPLPAESVDGILFSPPYSFAVDYVENDAQHIESLGERPDKLRDLMVGLRGKRGTPQVLSYIEDTKKILQACWRVLRPGKHCCVIVGTNEAQLAKLRSRPGLEALDDSLEDLFVRQGEEVGFRTRMEMRRPISGIANSMREEAIILFQKPNPPNPGLEE